MRYRNMVEAFDEAVVSGYLSYDASSPTYAGNYMYTGADDGGDVFRHVETGEYITVPPCLCDECGDIADTELLCGLWLCDGCMRDVVGTHAGTCAECTRGLDV